MIYIIATSDLPKSIINGCQIIIISNDSNRALISGTNIQDINIISSHEQSELDNILNESFWKQPCKDCEK